MSLKECIKRFFYYVVKGIPQHNVFVNISTLAASDLLKGRSALVTGGSGGIGKQIARAFLNAGAKVVIAGRDENKLLSIRTELSSLGEIDCLVLTEQSLEESFFAEIEKKYSFDILVNCVGTLGGNFNYLTEKDYDYVMDTNLKSATFLSVFFAKLWKNNGVEGNILNIASSSGFCPANSVYCLSKWAMRGLIEGLARMYAPYGIVVNGIAPGPTATSMLKKDASQNLYHAKLPNRRYSVPEEIAGMAVILVSGMGKSVVGEVVCMTGGAGNLTKENLDYSV